MSSLFESEAPVARASPPTRSPGRPGGSPRGAPAGFYAAQHLEPAVAEKVHHQQCLLREMRSGPRELRMPALRADTDAHPIDLRGLPADDPIYDPERYARKFGAEVHQERADLGDGRRVTVEQRTLISW